jgi:protein TonB
MGKIVKYCNSCDEGFAEKFAFCPDCGQALEAFEMNPLESADGPDAVLEMPPLAPVTEVIEASSRDESQAVTEPDVDTTAVETEAFVAPEIEMSAESEPQAEAVVSPSTPVFAQSTPLNADSMPVSFEAEHERAHAEGNYYLTVMEEKNVKQRNGLLLGTFGLMIFVVIFGVAYSIFSRDLDVAAINDDLFNAVLVDEVPMTDEEQMKQNQDKKAGGGGGGGREEEEEVTKGDLADQSKNPTRPPDAKVFRSDNFELKTPPPQTQGNMTFPKQYDRWGDPNGRFSSFSNGTGSGGGQGSGSGTGQGSGRGTGAGSGTGSGYGGGLGNGNGNGRGDGDDGNGPPPRSVGATTGIKILSKPRPGYTDSARQANIQGTVILRVTFMANGSIGSISAVKGLPNGLTEQAISAARRISFQPAMINGSPQSVTKQIEYSFSIY